MHGTDERHYPRFRHEDWAFRGCTGLTSVTIPESVTEIGEDAFLGCTGLTSVIIPDSVTEIGAGAFAGCTGLTSITIPDSVTEIGCNAFSGCTGLTSVTIPDSVTEIDGYAFCGCTGLTSITIPDSVTEIGYDAFRNCTGLTSITIPDSVTEIVSDAFRNCTGLTSVVIGNSVTKIRSDAFNGCTGLTSVTIPDSVTEIGRSAFEGCMGLTSIVVSKGNKVYDSRGDCNAIIETETNKLIKGCSTTVIPNSVTEIGRYAFCDCSGLTSITIPDSVTEIGEGAFNGCTGLTSVTIGAAVTIIGGNVFCGCGSLKQIILRITNPNQITTERGVELGGHQATVYVPDKKSVSAYKKKSVWKKFAAIEVLDMKDLYEVEKKIKEENKAFLNQLGITEAIPLLPIPHGFKAEDVLAVTYSINETQLPFTAKLYVKKDYEDLYMLVDGQSFQPIKEEVTFKTAGQHIIRILPCVRPDNIWVPDSELIKLPDSQTGFAPYEKPGGAKKLLLGARYEKEIPKTFNFDEIDVVPENPHYEMKNGCLIKKETKELVFASSKATEIPNDVKDIRSGSLRKYSPRAIRIPQSIKNFDYSFEKETKIKDIIIEEGVLSAGFSVSSASFIPFLDNSKPLTLSQVGIPSTLESLYMSDIEMDSIIVPANVKKVSFRDCQIKRLEIKGDLFHSIFSGFIKEIFLSGNVKPNETFEPGIGVQKFFGTLEDGCVIHVKDESVAQTIRDCADFNPNVKIIVDIDG